MKATADSFLSSTMSVLSDRYESLSLTMPSLVPGFEYDIFISYRHNDNLPDQRSGSEGWVTEFARNLDRELKSTIKDPVSIYYDRNPNDGLLETHHVDKSLEGKLRCLIFIPILSQTYCDPKSFAWQNEFCAFNRLSNVDPFGRDIRLGNRNVASRILPVLIHELEKSDLLSIEREIGGSLRGVDFTYKARGINRPLTPADDPDRNFNRTGYRDQINKLSLAIKELLNGLTSPDKERLPQIERSNKPVVQVNSRFIAVLPFVNMSNDPEQEYFSDGLTEELISTLARVKEMRVISRTTSMQYKASKKDVRTIGRETGVDFVLEGSVRKHGNNLRITAQFIDADRDTQVWTETYHGTIDDIFDIQEKVSSKIVEALKIQLTLGERDLLEKRFTENSEAYRLYLQGRYFWNRRDSEGLRTSVNYFQKAIEKDSGFALAWVGLADAYFLMGEFSLVTRRELLFRQKEAIQKALQLDDKLGEAHISWAICLMLNDWEWVRAGAEFRLGLELNPNYVTGHHWYSEWLLFAGDPREALVQISLAVDLDPVSKATLADKGKAFYYCRMYDEAIETLHRALELDARYSVSHRLLSLAYQASGKFIEALKENSQWGDLTGNRGKTAISEAQILAVAGKKDEALKILRKIEADEALYSQDYRGVALIYVALGEKDSAFDWFDKSVDAHEDSMCTLRVDPKIDLFREDPRFARLLRRVRLDAVQE